MRSAIILAGGMGTRLRSLLPELPKSMAPIGGRPFLEYQLDYWIGQGIQRFILSVGYKKEIIQGYFRNSYQGAMIEYIEECEPRGTGGALLLSAQNERDLIVVMNGDTFFKVNLKEIEQFHLSRNSDWTFALFRSNQQNRYMGLELETNGKVSSMKSGSRQIGCLANGGVYLINPSILEKSQYRAGEICSLEDELVPYFLKLNINIFGLEIDAPFIDIGVPSDYYRAASVIAQ